MPHKRRVDPYTELYRRGDGTLCYFYSTEDLISKASAAGFQALECKYACTRLLNRRKQFELPRVFVHGVFRRGDYTFCAYSAHTAKRDGYYVLMQCG